MSAKLLSSLLVAGEALFLFTPIGLVSTTARRMALSFAVSAGIFISAHAAIPESQVSRIVDCIYVVEGGAKTKHPYGILSVKVRDAGHARQVCARTVRNTHARWEAAGRPGDFLDFLADRYCPRSCDPVGNRNWKRNIHRLTK